MGITLDLRLVDHERIVVRGLPVVNDAIRGKDPGILREYLLTLPIEVDPELVEYHTERLTRLREFTAPEEIVQAAERFLAFAKGEPYQPAKIEQSTFDELRQLLGTWCWLNHSYSLDKSWQNLHWFLEPVDGTDDVTCPQYPEVGDPGQSVFCKGLKGAIPYPKDDLGDPIIRTLGSTEPGCSGYNPPETCKVIYEALQRVDPADWGELVPLRSDLYWRTGWGLTEDDIAILIEDELTFARDAFPILVAAYARAVEKGFGVSCEYSL